MFNFNTLLFVGVATLIMAVTVQDTLPFFNSFMHSMHFAPRPY